ncbi:MAG: sortase B protein-sorting domain-containing protein [Lachnoanaerobaculum sp.]|jgi:sortase B cell surface sorting signal|uniref:sortase B protein-sorting domain-containing protein n=1 Tax=Lachnoanaerobaculum sp. OBRC5-5 TaxID=936595 RepID=UPI00028251CD|nr:sortase B protein-sorting domain-containing protein [Lachnoanaerobaculum sp. OBRC5-5]EJZ71107.1 sortase B cell surface sorting signal [Lachnoanaerobaculum sp. OBRC5-5]MDU6629795.1 sortase B protein-sorting domain-containing protein [Lachnoanaerobaculum sp.]
MHLPIIKKTVLSLTLALGLVSGSVVAFAAPSQIIVPGKSADAASAQVINEGKITRIIGIEGEKAPSEIIIPGTSTVVVRSTASNATPSTATRSNSTASSSRGGSSSSSRSGSSRAVTATTAPTNTPAQNYGPAPSNTSAPATNVGPAAGNTNVSTKGDVTAAKRGKLNVPKTADASAMGLYAALLGLSTVAGAFVIATKKKEN